MCVCTQKVKPSTDSDQEEDTTLCDDGAHAQTGSNEQYSPTHVSERVAPVISALISHGVSVYMLFLFT